MKVLRRRILRTLILFGEILFVFTSTQHNHIHNHHHVHHHNTPARPHFNKGPEITTRKASDLITSKQFHTHKDQNKRSSNITGIEENISSKYKQRILNENNTRNLYKTEKMQIKGAKKDATRLKFKNKVKLNVQQHAAKSIELDCRVKGVTRKRNLVKWFKESVPIKGVMKG